ncbi:xanthine dehydrogenase small subunit [Bdellovibrio bacteriovorus]|uniref:xanthine dehydrogenase small subunit n=1 Tax=Bdellovibrio bacteriovorus TaxID=959 RepID=UPI0035A98862
MAQASIRNQIHLLINGVEHTVRGDEAFLPLAQYLRYHAHLPGTKVVCAEGDCGACTSLVARWNQDSWSSFQTLNSCIAPVYLFDLASVVTVEGLAMEEELSEVQIKMREFHGGQCGYCTPGMVCALSGLAESCSQKKTPITEKKARNHLTGNLCRCTGYEPILNSALHMDLKKWRPLAERYLLPAEQTKFQKLFADDISLEAPNKKAYLPKFLSEALEIKAQNPQVRIVSGATDLGVLHNKGKSFLDQVLVVNRIPDMGKMESTEKGLWVGAKVSLTEFENFAEESHPELSRLMRIFASPQIKNQGTLLGNVLNGSPIGDSIPGLLALNAEVHLLSKKGARVVPLTSFYKAYKSFDLLPEEIATGILIPHLQDSWRFKFYKVSLRKDLDISAVTFAAALRMDDDNILEARIALGGVGPTVVRLADIEKDLTGSKFSEQLFKTAGKNARKHIKPISDLRATEDYRLNVAENLFHKCFVELREERAVCL